MYAPTRIILFKVFKEQFDNNAARFLDQGEIAMRVNYNKDSMGLIENLVEIGCFFSYKKKRRAIVIRNYE